MKTLRNHLLGGVSKGTLILLFRGGLAERCTKS